MHGKRTVKSNPPPPAPPILHQTTPLTPTHLFSLSIRHPRKFANQEITACEPRVKIAAAFLAMKRDCAARALGNRNGGGLFFAQPWCFVVNGEVLGRIN